MRFVDFSTETDPWPTIDDVVMGGVSSSRMTIEGGAAVFAGVLSLDNNGGFSAARSLDREHDLSTCHGVRIRVRGDGKRYGLRLRTADAAAGVSFQVKIRPRAGSWQELVLPFADFEPVSRGRSVPGHPPLDPAGVTGFGLLIADRQAGPFRLELAWIDGAREGR